MCVEGGEFDEAEPVKEMMVSEGEGEGIGLGGVEKNRWRDARLQLTMYMRTHYTSELAEAGGG